MHKKISYSRHLLTLLGVAVVTTSGSYFYFNHQYQINKTENISSSELTKVDDLYQNILQNYVGEVDKDTLVDGALKGMTEAIGDPYSTYLPENEAQDLTDSLSSSIEGIGATLTIIDNQPQIAEAPVKGTPAQKAGLQAGDLILKVDGEDVTQQTLSEIVAKVRGKKGTDVKLSLSRAGEVFDVTITRDTVALNSVTGSMATDKIGLITISSFSENTAAEFAQQITDLRKTGAQSFILDVRQNPGGLLTQVEIMGSMLLDDEKTIVSFEDKAGNQTHDVASADIDQGFKVTEPVTILVDGNSASASEILAGAIKDNQRGKVIGVTTFGKGTVQNVNDLGDKSELKLTIGKWLTPNGTWVNEKGLTPDIEVTYPDFAYLTPISEDVTLQLGAADSNVQTLKTMLNGIGYELTVDTNYDEATEKAVADFQSKNDLAATGVFASDTNTKLQQALISQLQNNDAFVAKAISVLQGE